MPIASQPPFSRGHCSGTLFPRIFILPKAERTHPLLGLWPPTGVRITILPWFSAGLTRYTGHYSLAIREVTACGHLHCHNTESTADADQQHEGHRVDMGENIVPTVNTVLGPVNVNDLGLTLMHEHVLNSSAGIPQALPELVDQEEAISRGVTALKEAAAEGVHTLEGERLGRFPW